MSSIKRYKNNSSVLRLFLLTLIQISLFTGCEEFIEIDPPKTEIVSETVFTNDGSATAAVRGIYSLMMSNQSFTRSGIEEFTGILSDELINYSTRADQLQFYQNSLSVKNSYVLSIFWREAYKYINNANAVLEGLQKSSGITAPTKNQLEGEAKFIRAFCYFYITTLFGDVPYITTTDYRVNAVTSSVAQDDVYLAIEKDLLEASDLLATDFSFSNNERIQPNQGAAYALLARLYLYRRDWANAERYASLLIDNSATYSLVSLNEVFLMNSNETIWQLQPVVPGANAPQAQLFILTGAPNSSSRRVSLGAGLLNAFEQNDGRSLEWVGSFSNETSTWYFPYKYKVTTSTTVTEYNTIFRLAEQYLVRAESRAQMEDISGAQADVDMIRNRAGLPNTTAADKESLLLAIESERRIELFAEWGHRWMDLVRYERAEEVLSALKADWQSTDVLFPIPDSERLLNPNLSQNPGY